MKILGAVPCPRPEREQTPATRAAIARIQAAVQRVKEAAK